MARSSEDDREAVDRAFAELIAGYHLTADRPETPEVEVATADSPGPAEPSGPDPAWADQHPLFRLVEPAPEPRDVRDETGRTVGERYVPEPMPPLPRPGIPALLGWIGIGYAVLVVLLAAFGVPLPAWAGWLAAGGFLGGFAILLTRLPRTRPPDAGDGAVL